RNQYAAARSQGKSFDMALLRQVWRRPKRVAGRALRRSGDGKPADFLCGGNIAIEERRRQITKRRAVEAVVGLVFGQKRCGVNIEREQVVNGVLIFGAVEAPQCWGP